MKFSQLLTTLGGEPVFESSLLLAGDVDVGDVRRQLSRWTVAGKLVQLRRGLYCVAPPYHRAVPHPFVVANRLVRGSYVSLQSALSHHDLIPEYVPVITSVTTGRPVELVNAVGTFRFHHVDRRHFTGYEQLTLGGDQHAFVALPEKAVLDLVHLMPGGAGRLFLEGLRLQNLDRLDARRLQQLASAWRRPKLLAAAKIIAELAVTESEEYETL